MRSKEQSLYIFVIEFAGETVWNKKCEEIGHEPFPGFEGFFYDLIYSKNGYYQLKVDVYNPDVVGQLGSDFEDHFIIGGRLNVPILLDGKDYRYMFLLSEDIATWKDAYTAFRLDENGRLVSDDFESLKREMKTDERITGFQELMYYCAEKPELHEKTKKMVENTFVYSENFQSKKEPDKQGLVSSCEGLTLLGARLLYEKGKHVAVLNFANPVEPGGGVLRGANAQEENLCRSSNLFQSLMSENAESYYKKNRSILNKNQFRSMFLASDEVIYSPQVLILKENKDYYSGCTDAGMERYADFEYYVDILTCAAPFFSKSGYILPDGDLQHLFERRIRNIFEVAIDHEVDAIILGAFGCGAFHNPGEVVAEAFRIVLLEPRYRNAFDEVIFVIKRSAQGKCNNLGAFRERFIEKKMEPV